MNRGIIVFTLVVPEMRQFLLAEAAREGVPVYDIIGPLIEQMGKLLQMEPRCEPGPIRVLDEDYFRKSKRSSLRSSTMTGEIHAVF